MIALLRTLGIVLAVVCLAVVLAFCAEGGACGSCGHAFCAGFARIERLGAIVLSALVLCGAGLASARSLVPLQGDVRRRAAREHLALPSLLAMQVAPLRV